METEETYLFPLRFSGTVVPASCVTTAVRHTQKEDGVQGVGDSIRVGRKVDILLYLEFNLVKSAVTLNLTLSFR